MTSPPVRFRLFVYATLLEGEPEHDWLETAISLGPVRTASGYALVELGALGGLIETGDGSVVGELYEVVYDTLAHCDTKRDHPNLFHRKDVRLADDSVAHCYFLHLNQTRGRRRVRDGDWRQRFAPRKRPEAGPFVTWAKGRHSRK